MNKCVHWIAALAVVVAACGSARGQKPVDGSASWRTTLQQELPLLGHRNWILVVDSAYPEQNSTGIETLETGAPQDEVLRTVLEAIGHSIHVRPVVFMDAELPYIPEADAPGVSRYRAELQALLGNRPVTRLPHEELLGKVEATSSSYRVLILKTTATIPYTSVFLQLNCKYWSDDAEARLRAAMQRSAVQPH